jgi:5-methylcytosine-specific restriction endonuclease McrA
MNYVISLKAQLRNKANTMGGADSRMDAVTSKLRRIAKVLDEGGTGNPSLHNHLSQKYHYKNGTHCWYCDRKFLVDRLNNGRPCLITIDHIDPRVKGGTNSPFNYIAACHDCNGLKSKYKPIGFARRLDEIITLETDEEKLKRYKLMRIRAYKIHNKRIGWRKAISSLN